MQSLTRTPAWLMFKSRQASLSRSCALALGRRTKTRTHAINLLAALAGVRWARRRLLNLRVWSFRRLRLRLHAIQAEVRPAGCVCAVPEVEDRIQVRTLRPWPREPPCPRLAHSLAVARLSISACPPPPTSSLNYTSGPSPTLSRHSFNHLTIAVRPDWSTPQPRRLILANFQTT